jgi:hypothetical protein
VREGEGEDEGGGGEEREMKKCTKKGIALEQ